MVGTPEGLHRGTGTRGPSERLPVILRGLPATNKVPPPGETHKGRSLANRLATHLHFAGTSPADAFGSVLTAHGRLIIHALLVVPDEIDPGALANLRRWGEQNPVETIDGPKQWQVVTASDYFDPFATVTRQPWAFTPNAYTGAGPVLGWDLGRSFSAVAEYVADRNGRNLGKYTVWLPGWGRNSDGNGWKARSPHRPAMYLSAHRVGWSVDFAPRERGRGNWVGNHIWRGEFIDLHSLAYALDADRGAGFVEHSANFGLGAQELPVTAPLDARGAAAMTASVIQEHALALQLDEEVGRWFTTPTDRGEQTHRLPVARLQSPAAIADHLLRHFGCSAPLTRYLVSGEEAGGSEEKLARWWEAFHGGWTEDLPALRGRPFGALVLDVSSAYPLVAHLSRWWRVLTAEHLTEREATDEVRALADQVTADPRLTLDPATWERAAMVLVEIAPVDDVLPVALDDPHRPDGRTETVPVTARGRSMFYSLFDVLASGVLTGRSPSPRIIHASQLVAEGTQEGLSARVPFLPGLVLNVEDDPAVELVARRRQGKADGDRTLAPLLHTAVNALVYGKASQLDDVYVKTKNGYAAEERNSPWTFPPLAVTVTAGTRLLLAVFDRLVRDMGGVVAYRDTDSSIIPASEQGGTLTLGDGSTVRELTYAELTELAESFNTLSPVSPADWPVWKISPKPSEAPQRCIVFGPKRHVEYGGTDSAPELAEWTETLLGGMFADPAALPGRCAEGGRAWSKAVAEREVRYVAAKLANRATAVREQVPWDAPPSKPFPALRRLAVTSKAVASTLPEQLGPIRPGTRYIEAMAGRAGTRTETVHAVAMDPGGPLDNWSGLKWVDRSTGEPVAVTVDPMDRDAVLLETLAARATRYSSAPEGGEVGGVLVTPLSVEYRGRVSPVLDAVEYGNGDPSKVRHRYEDARGLEASQWEALVDLARSLSRSEFADVAGTTPRVAHQIASDRRVRRSTLQRILKNLRSTGGAWLAPRMRTCGLDGCGEPVRGQRVYCRTSHAEAGRKRRQRSSQQTTSVLEHPEGIERRDK